MTRVTTSTDLSSFSTDAKFRSWGSSFSAALTAAGLPLAADTGQIDWATVTKPVAASTVAGYEIRRFNDTLQSTHPVFIKIEYGSGANASGNNPRIVWTIGKGSNGAGTITNFWTSQIIPQTTSTTSNNTACVGLFTHTDGYFFAQQDSFLIGSPGYALAGIVIDRTRDQTTGAITSAGLYIAVINSNSGAPALSLTQYSIDFSTNAVVASPGLFSPPGDSASYGAYAFPCYSWINGLRVQAGLVGVSPSDVAASSTFTMKTIGSSITHTYLCIGSWDKATLLGDTSLGGLTNEGNYRIAVMWED